LWGSLCAIVKAMPEQGVGRQQEFQILARVVGPDEEKVRFAHRERIDARFVIDASSGFESRGVDSRIDSVNSLGRQMKLSDDFIAIVIGDGDYRLRRVERGKRHRDVLLELVDRSVRGGRSPRNQVVKGDHRVPRSGKKETKVLRLENLRGMMEYLFELRVSAGPALNAKLGQKALLLRRLGQADHLETGMLFQILGQLERIDFGAVDVRAVEMPSADADRSRPQSPTNVARRDARLGSLGEGAHPVQKIGIAV